MAIYGQPAIAHCTTQGEFLYPKIVGHKVIMLDGDEEKRKTEADTRKPDGLYGCFAMEDYLYLQKNKAYQSIRIKLSSSALEIRPWHIGEPTTFNDLMTSSTRRNWAAGCIEVTIPAQMQSVVHHTQHDVYRKMEDKQSPPAPVKMPHACNAEATAVQCLKMMLSHFWMHDALSSTYMKARSQLTNPGTERVNSQDMIPVQSSIAAVPENSSLYKERIYMFIPGNFA